MLQNASVDPKDPNESKFYTMDWTHGLNSGATITDSDWTIPDGLTNDADGIVTGSLKTTVQVSGGTAGQEYRVVNTVTTSDGETLVQAGILLVRDS